MLTVKQIDLLFQDIIKSEKMCQEDMDYCETEDRKNFWRGRKSGLYDVVQIIAFHIGLGIDSELLGESIEEYYKRWKETTNGNTESSDGQTK